MRRKRTVRTLAQSAHRNVKRKKKAAKPTPFETMFPPIRERKLPRTAPYL